MTVVIAQRNRSFNAKQEGIATTTITTTQSRLAPVRDRAIAAARTAADNRGRDIVVLDVRAMVTWMDFLVIATGSSRRQIITIADEVQAALERLGDTPHGVEGYTAGNWVLVDYGDVVVHIFDDEKRKYYELEHLWGDAAIVEWRAAETAPAMTGESVIALAAPAGGSP